jgi:hypothetical protein
MNNNQKLLIINIYFCDPDAGTYMTKTSDSKIVWLPLTLVKVG